MLFECGPLDDRELAVVDQVEKLKQVLRWQLNEPRRWVGSLRRLSFARNIQGSNSIEGFDAALDDAAAVIAGDEPLDANEETRLALAGYRDAMTYVLQLADEPDFEYSEQLIKSLHFMMTSYSLTNRPGRWRAGPIFVHNERTDEIVHEGADIADVPTLMQALVRSMEDVADSGLPVIVQGGMAHLNLAMIHPFRDGNGRMARCIQSLVLARQGVLSPVFMSIEEYLGRNTDDYYDVLGKVGGGSWQPERDTRPWVRFILTAHLRQARTLQTRVRESEQLWSLLDEVVAARGLPPRVTAALFDAALALRIRRSTYMSYFDETEAISEQTATRDLRQLVDAGLLLPRGEKRGRHYVGTHELRGIFRRIVDARKTRDDSDPFA